MKQAAFKMQISYDAEKLCALQKYMKDESELRSGMESLLDTLYQSHVPAAVREVIDKRNMAQSGEEPETLEQFVREHPNDVIQIMSPGGYVTIAPDRPLNELFAHAGERGTEIPVTWEELRGQTVESCHYHPADRSWNLLTVDPSLNQPVQAPEMRM
ncbi:hypothetical protein ACRQU7_10710 [Caproiciproducens sp. R1]|uniref:hypothetical protein n=1 Tax=Caproiciproducens sp. R1 TaxID=3435000 RepID=UPI004033EDE9